MGLAHLLDMQQPCVAFKAHKHAKGANPGDFTFNELVHLQACHQAHLGRFPVREHQFFGIAVHLDRHDGQGLPHQRVQILPFHQVRSGNEPPQAHHGRRYAAFVDPIHTRGDRLFFLLGLGQLFPGLIQHHLSNRNGHLTICVGFLEHNELALHIGRQQVLQFLSARGFAHGGFAHRQKRSGFAANVYINPVVGVLKGFALDPLPRLKRDGFFVEGSHEVLHGKGGSSGFCGHDGFNQQITSQKSEPDGRSRRDWLHPLTIAEGRSPGVSGHP